MTVDVMQMMIICASLSCVSLYITMLTIVIG